MDAEVIPRRVTVLVACTVAFGATLLARGQEAPRPGAIHVLDLTALNGLDLRDPARARLAWDTLHMVASVQGIVNRREARLFVRFMKHPDDFWLAELRREGNWLAGRPIVKVGSPIELLRVFAKDVRGLVVYKEDVRATSNLASTIAGIEDRVCLRHDRSADSVYGRVMATGLAFTGDVVRLFGPKGEPMFPAEAGKPIPGTGTPPIASTGSAKCDAHLWAARRYLDSGRASREYMAYYIDSYWLTDPTVSALPNCTLTNHDFFISRRAFFFDLHVWQEESPVDDRAQRPGTDVRTLRTLLRSMHRLAGGRVFHIGGFTPWAWKYTSHGRAGSKHGGVDSEWKYAQIISSYGGIMDADALGYSGMANASFYQHHPLKRQYRQNTRSTAEALRSGGLLDGDGGVAPYVFVMFYMGDYDSAAWLNYHVPLWWRDPARGRIPCAWAFNPNLDRRAPHAMHFARTHQSANDWFIAGDCGAGYLNPGMLSAPRREKSIGDGWQAWIDHNRPYFARYDLSITGFVIDGHSPGMGPAGLTAYRTFSPDGLIGQKIPAQGLCDGVMPFIRMKTDLGGSPAAAGATIAGMIGVGGPKFLPVRTILKSPTWHEKTMAAARGAPGGKMLRFVDPYTFLTLLKAHETRRGRVASTMPAVGRSVRYLAPRGARGLAPVSAPDGPFRLQRIAGRDAIVQQADKLRYVYFESARDFAHELPEAPACVLAVDVTLLDRRKGTLTVQYDSHDPAGAVDGAYTAAGPAELAGSGKWVTIRFELPRARFGARQNAGANLRLVNHPGELVLHEVTVRRIR